MHALPVQTDTPPLAFDLPLAIEPGADTYRLHQHLEGRFGPRVETGYLWTLANADQLCLVRCPGIKAGPIMLRPPTEGEVYNFHLRGLVKQKDAASGKRGWYRVDERAPRLRWLARRGEDHGFMVETAAVHATRLPIEKPGRPFWLDVSEFVGCLQVIDADKLAQALVDGIGGGRAWGLGMLLLQPTN